MPTDRGPCFLHAARERGPLGELTGLQLAALRFAQCGACLALWLRVDGGDVAELADGRTVDELMALDPQDLRGCSLAESEERIVPPHAKASTA